MRDVGIVTGNVVNIECQTHEDAEKAIAVAREVLLNIPQDRGFGWRTKRIADTLTADDNTVVFSEDCEALPVLDFIDVMKDVMKAIAKELEDILLDGSPDDYEILFEEEVNQKYEKEEEKRTHEKN